MCQQPTTPAMQPVGSFVCIFPSKALELDGESACRSDEHETIQNTVTCFNHSESHMLKGAGFATSFKGRSDREVFIGASHGCILAGTVNAEELAELLQVDSTSPAELVALAVAKFGSHGALQRISGSYTFVTYDEDVARVMVARSADAAAAPLYVGRASGLFIATDGPFDGLNELRAGHLMYGASLLSCATRQFALTQAEKAAGANSAKAAALAAMSPRKANALTMRRIGSEPVLNRLNLLKVTNSAPTSPLARSEASSDCGDSPRAPAGKYVPPSLRKRMEQEEKKAHIRVIAPVNVKDAKTHEANYRSVVDALLAQKWSKIYAENPQLAQVAAAR